MRINSWNQFVEISSKYPDEKRNPTFVFRGQADSSWRLETTLKRKLDKAKLSNKEALEFERLLMEWFIHITQSTELPVIRPDKEDILSWLEIMQHYRFPTRLLDWTRSINVGCYFACCSNLDSDGIIYRMNAGHLDWIQSIRKKLELEEGVKHSLQQVLKSMKGEEYIESFLLISNPRPSKRMLNQKSQLSISTDIFREHDKLADHIVFSNVMNWDGQSIFDKYIIPKELKTEFQSKLKENGTDTDFIYPDNDFFNRYEKELRAFIMKTLNRTMYNGVALPISKP
jgi:hypothetical protein